MTIEQQRHLIDRILAHAASGTTDEAPDVFALPTEAYLSPSRFAEEITLLRRLPLVLASASALPGPGAFCAVDAFDVPLLLTRDGDGQVHLFLNACTHRGARLVAGEQGCRNAFVCPYHGWRFTLEGELAHVTDAEGFAGLDPAGLGLVRLPVAEAHGLLWGALTPGARLDLVTFLGDFAAQLDGLHLGRYVPYRPEVLELTCNWKLYVENLLEAYHVPSAHPSEAAWTIGDLMISDRFGPHLRLIIPRPNIRELADVPRERWRLAPYAAISHFVFPNTLIVAKPGHLAVQRLWPQQVARCRLVHELWVPRGMADGAWQAGWEQNRTQDLAVVSDDCRIVETILAGAVPAGPFWAGRNEPNLRAFHEALNHALGAIAAGP